MASKSLGSINLQMRLAKEAGHSGELNDYGTICAAIKLDQVDNDVC
jgi:hypothetical protein